MPTLYFQFSNTGADQVFIVNDLLDSTRNPIFNGPVNHGDNSPSIECWQGGNGRGQVNIKGSIGPSQNRDIYDNNEIVDY